MDLIFFVIRSDLLVMFSAHNPSYSWFWTLWSYKFSTKIYIIYRNFIERKIYNMHLLVV